MTSNTVEEKIYRRQIFKGGLEKATLVKSKENVQKYFTRGELHNIFSFNDAKNSYTCDMINRLHGEYNGPSINIEDHVKLLR
jgi:hypothetical protein